LSQHTNTICGEIAKQRNCFAQQYTHTLHDTARRENASALRSLGINVLLSIISISAFLGGSEALARLQYTPQKLSYDGIFEYDNSKVFRLKKDLESTFHGEPFTTNSFGYRDEDMAEEKPEHTKRILVVGDSISFGDRVLDHETYPSVLESMLNGVTNNSRSKIEVINTAAPGNSPFQEYHDLKEGMRFDPDVIVLQFTLNDVIEQYAEWIFREMGDPEVSTEKTKTYSDVLLGVQNMSYVDHVLKQHSALYLFLKDMQGRIQFKASSGEEIVQKAQQQEVYTAERLVNDPTNPEVRKAWKNTLSWIEKMTNIAKESDTPFIILVTPFEFQFFRTQKYAHPQHILRKFAQKRGVYYVDLLEALQEEFATSNHKRVPQERRSTSGIIIATKQNAPEKLTAFWQKHFIDYDHPSPSGHTFTANILKPVVEEVLQNSAQ
jgi:lysophospholipase L1-like esterase